MFAKWQRRCREEPSDNKNCLTKERVHLSNESLKGIRRAKEFAREHGGAHNVIVNKSMCAAV